MDHEISSPRELRPIKIRQQPPVYRLLRYPFLYLSLRSEIVIPVARPKSNTNFLIRRNKVKLDFRNFQVRKIIREDEKQERESRNRLDSSRKLGRSRRRKLELEKSWQDGLLLPHFGSRTIEREWRNWCGRNAASSSKTVESRTCMRKRVIPRMINDRGINLEQRGQNKYLGGGIKRLCFSVSEFRMKYV